ncbi:MAG: hypothetical protein ACRCZO_19085 [Cetobacterium sp.]
MKNKQYTSKISLLVEMFKKGSEYSDKTPYVIEYTEDKKEVYYFDRALSEGFEPRDFFPVYFNKENAEYFVCEINKFLITKNKEMEEGGL